VEGGLRKYNTGDKFKEYLRHLWNYHYETPLYYYDADKKEVWQFKQWYEILFFF
jgi:hypothetical protein